MQVIYDAITALTDTFCRSDPASQPYMTMAEVNAVLVDLRDMPREVQEVAHENGLIPYIPADR